MEIEILKKLVEDGETQRSMAYILNVSQSTIKWWLKKYQLATKSMVGRKVLYTEEQLKSRRNKQGMESQRKRAVRRKLEFIKKLGGRCACCGYDKNWAALEFHHKNDKLIPMDLTSLGHYSEAVLALELEKCELLCSNCHREHHNQDKFF